MRLLGLKVQKTCIRLRCGLPARGHRRSSLVSLGIMTVQAIFIFQSLIYFKENIHLDNELGSSHNYATYFK